VRTSFAAFIIHAVRVFAAVVAMFAAGIMAWIVVMFITVLVGEPSGKFVIIGAVAIGIAAVCGGTFLSVRLITPGSVLHPVLAALSLAIAYLAICTVGDVGSLTVGLPSTAIVIAAVAALTFRSDKVAA
jgi:hypothetical protein